MPTTCVKYDDTTALQEVADAIAKARKIVVVTGAGISTNCGIPDFRSENGLYSKIQAQYDAARFKKIEPAPKRRRIMTRSASISLSRRHSSASQSASNGSSRRASLPNLKGKDMFDAMIWGNSLSTSIFLTFIASLRRQILTDVKNTTETHKFLKTLRDGGRLVRCYTQNIDGLEGREGLCSEITRGPGSRSRFSLQNLKQARDKTEQGGAGDGGCEVVELHGGLQHLRCELCRHLFRWDDEVAMEDEWHNIEEAILAGQSPQCSKCAKSAADRRGRGRRSLAVGRLRPDIVLYGEEHPAAHLIAPIVTHDLSLNPDILLILGTSLRVHGLKVMIKEFAKAVHSRSGRVIFVNNTKPPDSIWGDVIDLWVESDCDSWVADLRERRKDIWLPQGVDAQLRPTRDSKDNGAYLTHKILHNLGRISGRLSDRPAKRKRNDEDHNESFRIDTPRRGVCRHSAQQLARGFGTFSIKKLRRPNRSPNSKWTLAHAELPTSLYPTLYHPRRRPRRRPRIKLESPGPSSSPSPLMTPTTRRIKDMGRVDAILSSPLSGRRMWSL